MPSVLLARKQRTICCCSVKNLTNAAIESILPKNAFIPIPSSLPSFILVPWPICLTQKDSPKRDPDFWSQTHAWPKHEFSIRCKKEVMSQLLRCLRLQRLNDPLAMSYLHLSRCLRADIVILCQGRWLHLSLWRRGKHALANCLGKLVRWLNKHYPQVGAWLLWGLNKKERLNMIKYSSAL